MDADETLVLLASSSLAVVVGIRWYTRLLQRTMTPLSGMLAIRLLLGALPVALLIALGVTLVLGAAREVREHGEYVLLFVALGAAWLIGLSWAGGWLGLFARDDAVERNNLAAAIAVAGVLAGGMLVYACANLGEGDTMWTTIGPTFLGTTLILALWAAHQMLSGASDAIAIDRDVASGIRFAGMALSTGLIVGRAIAGDYASAVGTVRDLLLESWPAAPLAALAVVIQTRLRPTVAQPRPNVVTRGLVPALALLALGLGVVFFPRAFALPFTRQ